VTALPIGLDVEAAGLGLEAEPVRRGRAADERELLLALVEEDAVADHVAGRRRRDVLLRHPHRVVRGAVDRRRGDQVDRAGAAQHQVHHVVRLVVEHDGLAPGALLAAPVRELGRDDRVDVGADLRVAQQLDGAVGRVEDFLQVARCHPLLRDVRTPSPPAASRR
jgi:hypothetical protein